MSPFLFHIGKACVNDVFPEHCHDFSELVIIVGGTGVHHIGGLEHFARAGNVHVVNPGQIHGFSDAKDLTMYNISYNTELFSAIRSDVKAIPGFQSLFVLGAYPPGKEKDAPDATTDGLSIHELQTVNGMAEEMLEEFRAKREGYESLLVGCFLKLVVYLSRNYRPVRVEASSSLLKLAKTVSLIEQRFMERLSLRQLSEASGLSVRHMCRLFEENYGTSPTNYIIKTRLEYAAQLLKMESRSITEIAFESGFDDSNYFSRQFKSVFGVSPTSYRTLRPF